MQKNRNATIEFYDSLPHDVEEIMREDLVAYETAHGIDVNYKPFCLVLRGENQEVYGVLNAFTAFAEVYIDDMWVHQQHRKRGYGKMLLQTLEDQFEGKGFNNINLVTSAFQAPDFYKKCGFEIEFIRENIKNPKLTKTFFVKYLKMRFKPKGY